MCSLWSRAARWPACRLIPPSRDQTISDAPVPAELAAALGVLRRPQTAAEAALLDAPLGVGLPAPDLLRTSVRVARTLPDGRQVRLFVADRQLLPVRSAVCRTRELREVRRRIRGLPAQARRAASDAWVVGQTWFAADGSVVNRVD